MTKEISLAFILLFFSSSCKNSNAPRPLNVLNDSIVSSANSYEYSEICKEMRYHHISHPVMQSNPRLYSVSIRHENNCDLKLYTLTLHFGGQLVYSGPYTKILRVPLFIDQEAPHTVNIYLTRSKNSDTVVYHWKEVFPENFKSGRIFYDYNKVDIILERDRPNDFFYRGTCKVRLTSEKSRKT